MEIKKQYLQKYLHDIAVDQIAEEYQQKGYSITKEEQVGKKYRADLIARKNDETSRYCHFSCRTKKYHPT